MSELGRITVDDCDQGLRVVVRPVRNRPLAVFLGLWIAMVFGMLIAAGIILQEGRFGPIPWAVYLGGFSAMLAMASIALAWNFYARETLLVSDSSLIRTQRVLGFHSKVEIPASRIGRLEIRRIGAYKDLDIDYRFLGLGVWELRVLHGGKLRRFCRWVGGDEASTIANALRRRGFEVHGVVTR